ncbi:hypothetical protein 2 [Beihai sobemo-like virus 14]|uniref:hypothetical protein 2 n=1 Tax=Beihai sobemo-like virus 14 TaxID=1922685 RepID=UPI00090A2A46|nr:hypothetical protein 2 [Beihai sobemo-like virus 14]APG75739.1 hypothetical protein 2 [Beihai sobemo-like virus 14]
MVGYRGNRVEDLRLAVLLRLEELQEGKALNDVFSFIKQEPHKLAKAEQSMWRLISGLSCTDQLVATLLSEELMAYVVDHPMITNMGIGWGFAMEGGVSWLRNFMPSNPVAADKSSWDWTVQPWVYDCFLEIMLWLHDDFSTCKQKILRNHILSVCEEKVFDTGGGRLKQPAPGIVASGWKWTILFNCFGQLFLHYYADPEGRFPPPLTMGDDTIQEETDDEYWCQIKRTGAILKECQKEPIYCSMRLNDWGFVPENMGKYCYAFHHLDEELAVETLASYQWLFAYMPEQCAAIQRWLRLLGGAHFVTDMLYMQLYMEGRTNEW